jgi:phage gp29-like protein
MKIPYTNIEINFWSKPIAEVVNIDNQKSKPISDTIPVKYNLNRVRQDIASWRRAVIAAEMLRTYNRTELLRLYKDVVMDSHITAIMETRKNGVKCSKFIVMDKNGVEVKDKTELLNKQWFYDFIDLSLDSIFYGYSLIQFDNLVNDAFDGVCLVDRIYVKPELSLVVPNQAAIEGINYIETKKYADWLIGVGKPNDLGLLAKASPLYLYKKGALTAWSQYTDVFGQPIRVLKTDADDRKTLQEYDQALADMGSMGYLRMRSQDNMELLKGSDSSGQDAFKELIDICNQELSKLFLGQTGTTDEKAFAGSAGVHERILKEYNENDKKFIHFILQTQLVPFLNKHGFGFEGLNIGIEENEEIDINEKAKIDDMILKYFDVDPEYILKTYGTPVIGIKSKPNKVNE